MIIASVNHVFPANPEGMSHTVKLMTSNLLFALIGISPMLGVPISVIDLLPWLGSSNTLKKFGEAALQYPRIIIDAFLVYNLWTQGYTLTVLGICVSKVIYFLER